MTLNDLELDVIACTSMGFTEKKSLEYIKDKGYDISRRKYYYICGHISSETRKRAFEHAKSFLEDHINTIDELLNIKKMMYENTIKENDPLKNTMILAKITETMIPYISAYKEATKDIIIQEVKNKIGKEKESINLSTLGV